MILNEVNNIIRAWGSYLEYCQDKLRALFVIGIPKSLLPYPLEVIEEAINIVAKHYHDIGNHEESDLIKESFRALCCYTEDEDALEGTMMKFNIPEAKKSLISNMKKVQRDWIKTQRET